jgi:hypothetical protein
VNYNLKATKKAFDPIADDRYTLKVESTDVEPHSKNNIDGHKISITYRVVGGEFDNRKVWDNIYLPAAAWKARTILEKGGSDLFSSEDISAQNIADALVGLEVSAYLENSKSESGADRTNVKDYTAVSGNSGLMS